MRRKVKQKPYFNLFSQLFEQYEGKEFIQSILETLYTQQRCTFMKNEEIGASVSSLLRSVGIEHQIVEVDEATYEIVIN